ncbi:MAG TPA: transposase domain-containing protein [Spirochaetota bacterium]|nr:transposase domain-containing protein [Spirochaetota bacterium]
MTKNNVLTTKELANLLNITPEGLMKKAKESKWEYSYQKGVGRGGKTVIFEADKLPKDIQDLVFVKEREEAKKQNLADMPAWQRQETIDKFYLLSQLENAINDIKNRKIPRKDIIQMFIADFKEGKIGKEILDRNRNLSLRTLQRWEREYREYEETGDISCVAPQWGKRLGQSRLTDEEREFLYKFYLNEKRLGIATVYDGYVAKCKKEDKKPLSYSRICQIIEQIPELVKIKTRSCLSEKNFKQLYFPSTKRDCSTLSRMDVIMSDGHTLNFLVQDKGRVFRATLCCWVDVKTKKILGFDMAKSESVDLTIESLASAIAKYGVPKNVNIDNGKAYKNGQTVAKFSEGDRIKTIGTYNHLGINVVFTIPYSPRSKGQIEGLWDFVDDRYSKFFPTYLGKKIDTRPQEMRQTTKKLIEKGVEFPTMEEAYIKFERFIEWYNNRDHSTIGMSPNRAWDMEKNELQMIPEEKLMLGLLNRSVRVVTNNGIEFNGNAYRDKDGILISKYYDKKIFFGISRHDYSKAYAYEVAYNDKKEAIYGKRIAILERVEAIGWTIGQNAQNSEHHRAINTLNKKIKESIKSYLTDKATLKDITDLEGLLYGDYKSTNTTPTPTPEKNISESFPQQEELKGWKDPFDI